MKVACAPTPIRNYEHVKKSSKHELRIYFVDTPCFPIWTYIGECFAPSAPVSEKVLEDRTVTEAHPAARAHPLETRAETTC